MSGTRRTSVGDHCIDNLETWWRQPGFRDTADGANIATRNHVASAARSADKSEIGGNLVFDLSAQFVRLKGAAVLLVLVYMTNGLEKRRRNVAAGESHQEQQLVVLVHGRLGHDPRGDDKNGHGVLFRRSKQKASRS